MTDLSPKVATEPQTSKISIFHKNDSHFNGLQHISFTLAASKSNSSFSFPLQEKEGFISSCSCPNVLIADDDPIQALYYQHLFNKSMCYEGLSIQKEDLKVLIFSSGEELLDYYSQLKNCSCGSLLLIITDYHMGTQNLNGIETILALKKLDYKGPAVLRTGEKKEDLRLLCQDLDLLLKDKTIENVLDKSNHLETKTVIYNLLKARIDVDKSPLLLCKIISRRHTKTLP